MPFLPRAAVVAVALASLVACRLDERVPAGAAIRCDRDADCPQGWACRADARRCIRAGEGDNVAPGLAGPAALSPARARVGALVRLSFDTSEPLLEQPRVVLQTPLRAMEATADPEASTDTHFAYTWTLQGDEGEGVAFASTSLLDLAGNEARDVRLGTVVLDFTAPRLESGGLVVEPPRAAPGTTVVVRALFTEPLEAGLGLRLRAPAGGPADSTVAPRSESSGVATFVFPAPSTAGDWTLEVQGAVDLAGNPAAGGLETQTLAVDAEAPRLTALATDRGVYSRVAPFDAVQVSFAVSEVPALLQVLVGGALATCTPVPAQGGLVNCTRPVGTKDADGPAFVTVLAADAVGNAAQAQALVRFDFLPPQVVDGSVRLDLEPPPDTPSPAVAHLGPLGRALLSFNVTEPLAVPPTVSAPAPDRLDFALTTQQSTFYSFTHTLTATSHVEGARALEAELVDPVGNRALAPLVPGGAGLVVDVTPPSPPDVASPTAVVLLRKLWGDAASAQARLELWGAPGATAGEGTLVAWSAAVPPRFSYGQTATAADGAFPTFAFSAQANPRTIWVQSYDLAGNGSVAVPVRNVELVASLRGRVPNDPVANPHRLDRRGRLGDSLHQERLVELAGDPAAAPDAGLHVAAAGTRWLANAGLDDHPLGEGAAVSWDEARGLLTWFGGRKSLDGGTSLFDLDQSWDYDGERWRFRGSGGGAAGPQGGQATSVFDTRTGRTLVPDQEFTWARSGASWSQLPHFEGLYRGSTLTSLGGVPLGVSPFGVPLVWSGDAWQGSRTDGGAVPSVQGFPRLATDEARGRAVLVDLSRPTAVWEYDGAGWTSVAARDPEGDGNPAASTEGQLAWDGVSGRVLWVQPLDVWAWTGASWARRTVGDPEGDGSPAVSRGYRAVWFPPSRRLLLVGGAWVDLTVQALPETWAWEGASWRRVADGWGRGNPGERASAAFAFDKAAGESVLAPSLGSPDGVTWALRDGRWAQVAWAGPSGRAGFGAGLAFGADAGLMFGGLTATGVSDETWLYGARAWSLRVLTVADGGAPPVPTISHSIAHDDARGVFVIAGGLDALRQPTNSTWETDLTSWWKAEAAAADAGWTPSTLAAGCAAYDHARSRVVHLGGLRGGTLLDTFWEWTGAAWLPLSPADPEGDGNPPAREGCSLVSDPLRQRLYLFAGATPTASFGDSDLWEWNGTSWTRLTDPDVEQDGKPFERRDAQLSFDPGARSALMYGGFIYGYTLSDTWTLDLAEGRRPALVARFDLTNVPADAVLERLELRARAGGRGDDSVAATSTLAGAELLGWSRDGWVPLGSTAADVASPGTFVAQVSAPVEVSRLVPFAGRPLTVAVASRGVTAQQRARVSVDLLELSVRYRLP